MVRQNRLFNPLVYVHLLNKVVSAHDMFLISFRLVFLQKFRLFLPVLPEFKKSNVMKQPRHAFDKAMELYEKGFYYEAKNLYACVLRENPGDMAAKYYIFRCEALQEKNQ